MRALRLLLEVSRVNIDSMSAPHCVAALSTQQTAKICCSPRPKFITRGIIRYKILLLSTFGCPVPSQDYEPTLTTWTAPLLLRNALQ